MRIIGGKYKGRKLATPTGGHVRPTSDRLRESLFNILAHSELGLEDLLVMDIFAGTGSQGLEALSRGAEKCIFVEKSPQSISLLEANRELLDDSADAIILRQDATRLSHSPSLYKNAVELVFMDAPFEKAQELTEKALIALYQGEWLAENAWIIVKFPAKTHFEPPKPYHSLRNIKAGGAQAFILEVKEN